MSNDENSKTLETNTTQTRGGMKRRDLLLSGSRRRFGAHGCRADKPGGSAATGGGAGIGRSAAEHRLYHGR